MNTQLNNQTTPALGGLFSWLKKAVRNVVNAVAQVSHNPLFIFDILEDAFDGNGFDIGYSSSFNRGIMQDFSLDTNLTPQDEYMLDTWIENKFLPLYKTYFSTIKDYSLNPPTIDVFNDYYNEAQEFVALIDWYKKYVIVNGEGLFTPEALQARNQFFDVQIQLLNAEISNYISTTNIKIEQKSVTRIISRSEYLILGFNMPPSISLQVMQTNEKSIDGSNIVNNTTTNITPTTNVNTKKTLGAGVLVLALIGLGFLYSLNRNEKEKETEELE